ncbi:MAG: hypothetical protein AAF682_15170 [Planctomycetota bacterium]
MHRSTPLLAAALLATAVLGQAPASLANPGFATRDFTLPQVEGGYAVFAVSEAGQGDTDLNGDGDTTDTILHVYDAAAGATTNVGVGCPLYYAGDGHVAIVGDEAMSGDLNGDGDALEFVFLVYDLAAGTLTALDIGGVIARWSDGLLFLEAREIDGSTVDLNGDGDLNDNILHVYDPATGALLDTGMASRVEETGVVAGRVAFRGLEYEQGTDLNGDGDLGDSVLHTIEVATGAVTNFGQSIGDVHASEGKLVFSVYEYNQGGVDLNGDGDDFDYVLAYADPLAPASVVYVPLAMRPGEWGVVGDRVWFCADESAQAGTDLNGDADAFDQVLFLYRVSTGLLEGSGLDAMPGPYSWTSYPVADGSRIAFLVNEVDQGFTDLNGDGDLLDNVLHVQHVGTSGVLNLGIATLQPWWHGHRLIHAVFESDVGLDLTGDGDKSDTALRVYDLATGASVGPTGAVYGGASDVCFLNYEWAVGDLNGDGDVNDRVPVAYDSATGASGSLGVAVYAMGDLTSFGSSKNPAGANETLIAVLADEPDHSVDLNGDGDLLDQVAMVVVPGYAHGLLSDADQISVSQGGTQSFRIEAGHQTGPHLYWIAGTVSGTTPGTPVGGGLVLPLNPDPYFLLTLNKPNQGALVNTQGPLDSMGDGTAALVVPPGTSATLAGTLAHHAFGVIDLATLEVRAVSNAVPLALLP